MSSGSGNVGADVRAYSKRPRNLENGIVNALELQDYNINYLKGQIIKLQSEIKILENKLNSLARNGFAGGSKKRATGIVRKKKYSKKK